MTTTLSERTVSATRDLKRIKEYARDRASEIERPLHLTFEDFSDKAAYHYLLVIWSKSRRISSVTCLAGLTGTPY